MKQGDRVQEVTNTVGTGALTLLGSTGGHRSFLEEIGEGFETTYLIKVDSSTWEISRGTLTGTTLTRTLVKSSTGSLLDLPAGTHYVTQVLDAATTNLHVRSSDVDQIVEITQAAYDALNPPVATTLYVIVG